MSIEDYNQIESDIIASYSGLSPDMDAEKVVSKFVSITFDVHRLYVNDKHQEPTPAQLMRWKQKFVTRFINNYVDYKCYSREETLDNLKGFRINWEP